MDCFGFARNDAYNVHDMIQHTPEEIVRRATAAFNAGRRDEAASFANKAWSARPAIRCSAISWPPCCFPKARSQSARGHVETSLARRPDNAAARLLAARIARAVRDFDGALSHLDRAIAIAPQREAFLEKARTLDQAGLRPQARQAWRAILDVIPENIEAAARLGRLAWEDGDHAPGRVVCWNARCKARLPRRSGSISASSARICATMMAPPSLPQGDRDKA